ncbi:MAG: hypothetical protein ACOYK6_00480 [Chthoniobacterales bacterium]
MELNIETFNKFASENSNRPAQKTRVILGADNSLKEVSGHWWGWENWTIFGKKSAYINANRAIVLRFKQARKSKYDHLDFSSFAPDLNEESPLTIHTIREVIRKANREDILKKTAELEQKIERLEEIFNQIRQCHNEPIFKRNAKKEFLNDIYAEIPQPFLGNLTHSYLRKAKKNTEFIKTNLNTTSWSLAYLDSDFFERSELTLKEANSNYENAVEQCAPLLQLDTDDLKKLLTQTTMRSSVIKELRSKNISFIDSYAGITNAVVESSRESKIAADSSSVCSNKLLECDDFPKPNDYGKLFVELYRKNCNNWASVYADYYIQKRAITVSQNQFEGTEPSTKYLEKGLLGLQNPTGNCAVNSSLQLLKTALLSTQEHASSEEWEQLSNNITKKMPALWHFLKNDSRSFTSKECQELHKQVARVLHEDFWYSVMSDFGIAKQHVDEGYCFGSIGEHLLPVLLHQFGMPPIYFEQTSHDGITSHHALQTLPLTSPVSSSESSTATVQEMVNRQFTHAGCKLEDPLPSTLCIRIVETVTMSDVLESMELFDKNGNRVLYEPKSISCNVFKATDSHSCAFEDGHVFAFVKQKGWWYEVNDNFIHPIPKYWEEDLQSYCAKHATLIVYEKKQTEEKEMLREEPQYVELSPSKMQNNLLDREKEFSFLKQQEFLSGAVMSPDEEDELRKCSIEYSKNSKNKNRAIRIEVVEKYQEFWRKRIAQCTEGKNNATASFQPYWEGVLEDAQSNELYWSKELRKEKRSTFVNRLMFENW